MADGDAERTRLANERTYLAWWRTGIAGVLEFVEGAVRYGVAAGIASILLVLIAP